ncbi:MAG: hypothetical protein L3J67_13645, partial [Hyphomicrobiaceae bacterium]|nr:hypothetical protein [Hyphomicrobiaceae bacterium]
MPRKNSIITRRVIAIVTALVVPLVLIPTSGNARPAQSEWDFLDQVVKVKYQGNAKTTNESLRGFFDGEAPRNTLSKTRKRQYSGQRRGSRYNRANRRGNGSGYYEEDLVMSCATPRQIHRRLHRQGWTDFHNLRIRANALAFKARQKYQIGEGRELTYNLRIDRCTGALLKAKLQFKDRWFIRWMRRLSA